MTMRTVRASLVALVALAAVLVGPAVAAAPPDQHPVDWSAEVNFAGTGLDPSDAADAALLKMLSPERIRDQAERGRFRRQLASLVTAQAAVRSAAHRAGATKAAADSAVLGVAAPAAVDSIDPGCQLTSSNPDGLDLCGYDSAGDTMSAFGSGRKHRMWAGVQESDTQPIGGANSWRVWYKSQAYGLTSDNVNHVVNVNQWQAWSSNLNGSGGTIEGEQDPPQQGPCAPCYKTGSFRAWVSGKRFADSFQRTFVQISGTNDQSSTLNGYCSGWWNRDQGISQWPGVYNALCPGL
jgi:hypothetical protein